MPDQTWIDPNMALDDLLGHKITGVKRDFVAGTLRFELENGVELEVDTGSARLRKPERSVLGPSSP